MFRNLNQFMRLKNMGGYPANGLFSFNKSSQFDRPSNMILSGALLNCNHDLNNSNLLHKNTMQH